MTAMPCGQKNKSREMIQSQIVIPPFAAIEGTTLRLKTATTNSKTKSRRPSARISFGAASDWDVVDKVSFAPAQKQVPHPGLRPGSE